MMEARLDALFKKPEEYTVIERFAVIRHKITAEHHVVFLALYLCYSKKMLLGGF